MDHLKINQREPPVITQELIDYLKSRFTGALPADIQADPHKVNFKIGQFSVVKHLEAVMDQQQEDSRNSTIEVF